MAYITHRENGKTIKVATGCLYEDKIGAQIKLREYIEDFQRTGCRPRKLVKLSLQGQIESFYQYQLARQLTPKQASSNKMRVTRLCELARISTLDDLTETRIQTALANLRCQAMSPKSKPEEMPLVSPRTRNMYLKSLKTFLNWLIRNDDLSRNPLKSMRCENEDVDIRHSRSALSEEEFARLCMAAKDSARVIEGLDGSTRAFAYVLAAATGLRRGELASLTATSFRLDDGSPCVVVEAACSKRRRRDVVPLAAHLVAEVVAALIAIQHGGFLFPGLKTKKTHLMIKEDLEVAGLEYQDPADGSYRDWHSLRHLFVSRMWRSGAAPHTVKSLARHSDFRLTLRYAHNSSQELHDAVNAIPKLPA